ncbi:MAG TPA: serine hydrolase domain-containing protein [Candidatus Acidoferrales bacterium]|nr:serine hydrolase domain-containing protein [Candidatus Acidoferrales bacterium]
MIAHRLAKAFASVVLAIAAVAMLPQLARADAADDLVAQAMRKDHVPGLSLAVVKDGRIVKMRGYGWADVEQQVAATPQTVYQTGSIGKQFTSMLVMMLVGDGVLKLDDPITKYLGTPNAAWRPITIRMLLTHTSGISNDALDDGNLSLTYTPDQVLKMIAKTPLDFKPGTKWKYSNCGYELLGFIVKKATGTFYGDLLARRVWMPLGMGQTRIIDLADIVPHRAPGYVWESGKLQNQPYVSQSWNTTADGSMYTSVEDMVKWIAALDAQRFISAAAYRQMYTPVRLANGKTKPYGFGWEIDSYKGGRVYEHDGVWQGFTGVVARYVDAHVSVVVLSNMGDSDAVSDLGDSIARAYINSR